MFSEFIAQPLLWVPAIVLGLKFATALVPYLRRRDWYSLYTSWAMLGVELSGVSLALFISLVAAVDPSRVGPLVMGGIVGTLFGLMALLGLAIIVGASARRVGRDCVAGVHKVPALKGMFDDECASRMVKSIATLTGYSKGRSGLWLGVVWLGCSIAIGSAACAWMAVALAGVAL